MVHQIYDVYTQITKFESRIKICNIFDKFDEKAQVIITTIGSLLKSFKGRNSDKLKQLKCLVIDEADFFFTDANVLADMENLKKEVLSKLPKEIQFVLFSATYKGDVNTRISEFVTKAYQIKVKIENLKHPKLQVFRYRVPAKTKIDFLMEIFNDSLCVQCVVFVNTKAFAETVFRKMKEQGYKPCIIFSKMDNDERDEYIRKFREREVNFVITTNMLSRGIDIPEIKLVVNFDIPKQKVDGKFVPDSENYLHRIGRAGRFGSGGVAINLVDNDEDDKLLGEILDDLKVREFQ